MVEGKRVNQRAAASRIQNNGKDRVTEGRNIMAHFISMHTFFAFLLTLARIQRFPLQQELACAPAFHSLCRVEDQYD